MPRPVSRWPLGGALAAVAASVALACVTGDAPLVAADSTRLQEIEVRAAYQQLRARVFRIGHRLRSRAVALCGDLLLPDPGLLLAAPDRSAALVPDDGSLGAKLVADASAGLRVVLVAPQAPAARLGVLAGDVVLALDGQPIADVGQLNAGLLAAADREVTLTLRCSQRSYDVVTRIPAVCGVPISFSEDWGLMTFQDGYGVAVPYGLVETVDDDALAIAIAHQMAHSLIELAEHGVEDVEATADRLGLLIAASAGFDPALAPAFWTWLASENPWRIPRSSAARLVRPHPEIRGGAIRYPAWQLHLGIAARMPGIRATVEEIERLRATASGPGDDLRIDP